MSAFRFWFLIGLLCLVEIGYGQLSVTQQQAVKSVHSIKGDYYNDYYASKIALNYYVQAVNDRPESGYAKAQLGSLYLELDQVDSSLYWFGQAYDLKVPMSEKHLRQYFLALAQSNQPKKAYEVMKAYQVVLEGKDVANYKDTAFVMLNKLALEISSENRIQLWNNELAFEDASGAWMTLTKAGVEPLAIEGLNLEKVRSLAWIPSLNQLLVLKQESEDRLQLYSGEKQPNELYDLNRVKWKKFEDLPITLATSEQSSTLYFNASNSDSKETKLYQSTWNGKKWASPTPSVIQPDKKQVFFPNFYEHQLFMGVGDGSHDEVYAYSIVSGKGQTVGSPYNSLESSVGLFWTSDDEGFLIKRIEKDLEVYSVTKFQTKIPKSEKRERLIINVSKGGLPIYSSGGSTITIKSEEENIDFMIIPGTDYRMNIHLENHRYGPQERKTRQLQLPQGDLFTFNIRTVSLSKHHQSEWLDPYENKVEDIRLYPGDLVTFELLPKGPIKTETRVLYRDFEETLPANQIIDFGYVIEESITPPTKEELEEQLTDEASVLAKEPLLAVEENNSSPEQDRSDQETLVDLDSLTMVSEDSLMVASKLQTEDLQDTATVSAVISDLLAAGDSTLVNDPKQIMDSLALAVASDNQDSIQWQPEQQEELVQDSLLVALDEDSPANPSDSVEFSESTAVAMSEPDSMDLKNEEILNRITLLEEENRAVMDTSGILALENEILDSESTTEIAEVRDLEDFSSLNEESQVVVYKEYKTDELNKKLGEEMVNPSSNTSRICYRVQVAAALKSIAPQELASIYRGPLEVKSFQDKGYFKYYIAEVSSYKQANELRLSSGVEDAFIVKCPVAMIDETNYVASSTMESPQLNSQQEEHPQLTRQPEQDHEEQRNVPTTVESADSLAQMDLVAEASAAMEETPFSAPEIDSLQMDQTSTVSRAEVEEHLTQDAVETEATANEQSLLVNTSPDDSLMVDSELMETNELPISAEAIVANETLSASDSSMVLANNSQLAQQEMVDSEPLAASLTDQEVTNENVVSEKMNLLSDVSSHPDRESTLQYRLQVAAAIRPLTPAELKRIYKGPLSVQQFREDQYIKYYVAELPSYFLIREIQKDQQLDGSYIVAYQSTEKLTISKALQEQYAERMQTKSMTLKDSVMEVITVYFDLDEFILPASQLKPIQRVRQTLQSHPQWYAVVDGHTDIQGNDAYNFGLSEERALHVQKLLVQQGIVRDRILTNYYGESHLAEECDHPGDCSEEAHQANRRVEILLVAPGQ